jgi:phosphatidylethanolamine/phosphatidyl-N-methylethanolamine N-methyltransferase
MAVFDRASITRTYDRWAPVYDFVFGKVFDAGRGASIAAAERVGGRILEVGVGTGISLERYSRQNRITGVDISAPMLRKAQERVRALGLTNVDALSVMDAAKLAFPDASFDVVVAQYVITAVPDPDATLDEFARVLRPGGEIILVNHIGAESGPRAIFEAGFATGRNGTAA